MFTEPREIIYFRRNAALPRNYISVGLLHSIFLNMIHDKRGNVPSHGETKGKTLHRSIIDQCVPLNKCPRSRRDQRKDVTQKYH